MSTREELLEGAPIIEKVELPGAKSVWVRALMQDEAEHLKGASDSKFFAAVVCGENGNRLFDPNDPSDIALIGKMPAARVRKVVQAMLRISGFTEETAKN
jgi:hypothetical protein